MKLFLDSAQRFTRKVSLTDEIVQKVDEAQAEVDLVVLIDRLLKKTRTPLTDLTQVAAKRKGASRVGVNVGLAAANALNYALGLKKVADLEFPEESFDEFR